MFKHSHNPKAIAKRLERQKRPNYLRDWIYGGIDGVITTFAIVAAVVGADLTVTVILILGFANLFADGLSMAASNYLGTQAERDERAAYKAFEEQQIIKDPSGEREEINQIFQAKGFSGQQLNEITEVITDNKSLWIETMLYEEYGLTPKTRAPLKSALATFTAFLICGLVPLLPYIFSLSQAYYWAWGLSCIMFFSIGAIKSVWSIEYWWLSGIKTLVIGGVAALVAFGVGRLLESLI